MARVTVNRARIQAIRDGGTAEYPYPTDLFSAKKQAWREAAHAEVDNATTFYELKDILHDLIDNMAGPA